MEATLRIGFPCVKLTLRVSPNKTCLNWYSKDSCHLFLLPLNRTYTPVERLNLLRALHSTSGLPFCTLGRLGGVVVYIRSSAFPSCKGHQL